MNSRFYIPTKPVLKNVFHSIWAVEGFIPFYKEYIVPKGVMEIIFNFSDNPTIPAELNNRKYTLPLCFINGFNTAPVITELPRQQNFFGVRLQPLAIKKIFGTPAAEFLDIPVDLTLLAPEFLSLWHQLAEQNDFDARVVTFSNWAEKKCIDWHPQELLINDFLCSVNRHDISIPGLAGALCYSPRHLSRKLVEATGLNTEEVLHYKKYLHAVHLMHHTNLSLTEIAYQSHFADQAHFIRSFKQYAKMTPGEYKRNKSNVVGHLYQNVR